MAELSISYFSGNGTETTYVSLPDAEAEPEMSRLVKAAPDDTAKMDAMMGWLAKNPRKVESAQIGGVDEATARRYAKALAAPTLSLSVEKLRGDWLAAEHAATLVDLDIDDISALELSALAELPKLRRLAIWAAEPIDLTFLTRLPALRELRVGGVDALVLPKLPRLETLTLVALTVADGGLAGATALTSLTLDGAALGKKPGAFPALERLHYEGQREEPLAAFFNGTPALKSVTGNLLNIPERATVSLDMLAPCTSLEEIQLDVRKLDGLGTLAKLPKLTSLALNADTPGVVDVVKLKLTGLTTLKAYGQLTVANIDKAPKLVELCVSTIDDLAPLASLPALERFQVHKGKGLSLKPLVGLANLTSVDLGYETRVSAKMLEPLAMRTGLTIYSKAGFRDAGELYGELTGRIKVPSQTDHPRPAFALKGTKGDPGCTASHSFGSPYLADGETWPVCGNCEKPMPCLLQLDLKPLDKWNGFLQVFYCTNKDPHCEVECKTWKGVGPSMHLRIVTPAPNSAAIAPKGLPKTKPQALTADEKASADLPGMDDAEELGVRDAPKEPKKGDKLGGWPHWLQGPEWPVCEDCSKKMTLLAQLQSNKAVAHQWGDLGYAYVFACADHRERLGFCWASG